MKARLLKEARQLLPAWVAALLLASLPVLLAPGSMGEGWPPIALAVGLALLSVASFGSEFSQRTFTMLVTQPVSRERLWWEKISVLAAGVIAVTGIFVLAWHVSARSGEVETFHATQFAACAALVTFAGGLCLTLLLRQVLAALVLTILVPVVLLMTFAWLAETWLPPNGFPGRREVLLDRILICVALPLYAALAFGLARWLFLRAQDVQWTGGTISFSLARLWPAQMHAGAPVKPRGRWLALVLKELHLQQVSLLLIVLAAGFHVVVMASRMLADNFPSARINDWLQVLATLVWFVWFIIPVLLGATAFAEERKLGTLEGAMCLPARRGVQFLVKFGSVLFLSVVCSALLPLLLESIGARMGLPPEVDLPKQNWLAVTVLMVLGAVIGTISFHASTLAGNTLHGIGVAVMSGAVVSALMAAADFGQRPFLRLWQGPLIYFIGWPVMLAVLVWLSYANWQRPLEERSNWFRNLRIVILSLVLVTAGTSLAYYRAWELLLPREPAHGPARLHAPVKAKLCFGALSRQHVFALLPDGRIWVSSEARPEPSVTDLANAVAFVPRSGRFLEFSNWVDVGSSLFQVHAIQSDGTLWQVFSFDRKTDTSSWRLIQIGSGTNWLSVTGGSSHCLAVQRDGTLWGWGINGNRQLGNYSADLISTPVRVGKDSDWIRAFVAGATSVGVKRDGSVWKWGWLPTQPDGSPFPPGSGPPCFSEPTRWGIAPSNVTSFAGTTFFDLCVTGEGALWGGSCYSLTRGGMAADRVSRVDPVSDWREAVCGGLYIVALKQDGTLWKDERIEQVPYSTGVSLSRASDYSDWIAIGSGLDGDVLALARDGTLCAWVPPPRRIHLLLMPTRKPFWSLNILDSQIQTPSPQEQ